MPNELSKYGQEAELADRVRTLCNRDMKYITMLRKIIAVDEIYRDNRFGWGFADVQLT